MLAYSSVAHAGFMMFALFALNSTAWEGLILYAAGYSIATIGLFAVDHASNVNLYVCPCVKFKPVWLRFTS